MDLALRIRAQVEAPAQLEEREDPARPADLADREAQGMNPSSATTGKSCVATTPVSTHRSPNMDAAPKRASRVTPKDPTFSNPYAMAKANAPTLAAKLAGSPAKGTQISANPPFPHQNAAEAARIAARLEWQAISHAQNPDNADAPSQKHATRPT